MTSRADRVDAAVQSWIGQLMDLGPRNNLVFYRDQRSGTLDLSTIPAPAISALVSGRPIQVAAQFGAPEIRNDVLRRLRRISGKAREYFEEQGIPTLYLAFGLASWATDRTPVRPSSPVLLRPATLRSQGAAQNEFTLTPIGDLEINPTLLALLAAEFDKSIDPEKLMPLIEGSIDTLREIQAAFDWLRSQASGVPEFEIRQNVVLANFSYAKLPMVQDLQSAGEALRAHDMIAALAGDQAAIKAVQDQDRAVNVALTAPDVDLPGQETIFIDADSSQSYVINAVMAGRSLIVKGPPGTGKSQTISNLMATAAARGKTILFVAEKRAAIDAVLKRLRDAGLGDLVLDRTALETRRQVAETLDHALTTVGSAPPLAPDSEMAGFVRARNRLGEHVAVAHQPRAPWQVSLYEARLQCHHTPELARTDARLTPAQLATLDAPGFEKARELMGTLAELDPFAGKLSASGWIGLVDAGPDDLQHTFDAVARLRGQVLGPALERLETEAEDTGLPGPATVGVWKAYATAWRDIDEAMRLFGPDVFGPENGMVAGIQVADGAHSEAEGAALRLSRHDAHLLGEWEAQFPSLFRHRPAGELDLDAADLLAAYQLPRSRLARTRDRLFDGRYKAARSRVRGLLTVPWTSDAEASKTLASAISAARLWRDCRGHGRPRLARDSTEAMGPDFWTVYEALEAIRPLLDRPAGAAIPSNGDSPGFESLTIDELRHALDTLIDERAVMLRLPRLHECLKALAALGLDQIVDEMRSERLAADLFVDRLDFVWARSILDQLELADPRIAAFDPALQDAAAADFERLDGEEIALNVSRIKRYYAERVIATVDRFREQANLIVHQAALRSGHMPLRRLFGEAPDMLLALKPCWAMSPLMVSQSLPSDRRLFDIVVFDEASQVLPADGVPAILRGTQLVVAGDDRQLPPTTFFASQSLDEADPDSANEATTGFESVLDAVTPILGTSMLRWHYRSRDEALIAFSNRYFYEGGLTTFPSPSRRSAIRHVLVQPKAAKAVKAGAVPAPVPRSDSDASDDANPAASLESSADEVAKVVELVLEAAEKRPNESLGVIAFSITHAERIAEAIRVAVKHRRDLDSFFAEDAREAFFVKNLERVQGDEREAIILSVGYSKTGDGRMYLRFGPINMEGGERRLNVAITRARGRMTVVSSFLAGDIDARKGASRGAQMLRDYLAYAQSGGWENDTNGSPEPSSPELTPLEQDVVDGLAAAGIGVVPRLGESGQTIGFAALHPRDRERYVLAVELDDPAYGAIPTVRDRDRLREEQLERLGWRFHRLWTEHWLADRDAAIAAIRQAFEAAVAAADALPPSSPPSALPIPPAPDPTGGPPEAPADSAPTAPPPQPRGDRPRLPLGLAARAYSEQQLQAMAGWVDSDGVVRPESEVAAIVARELGLRRIPQARLYEAIWRSRWERINPYKAHPRPVIYQEPTLQELRLLVAWVESDKRSRTKDQVVAEALAELGGDTGDSTLAPDLHLAVQQARGKLNFRKCPRVPYEPGDGDIRNLARWIASDGVVRSLDQMVAAVMHEMRASPSNLTLAADVRSALAPKRGGFFS
jgi:hypothetical protein